MVDKKIFYKLLFFTFFCYFCFAFEQIEYIGEINYPKSLKFENIEIDSVERIYLSQKGKRSIFVYNKYGSHIDTINLAGKNYFTRGGDFLIDKHGNLIVIDTSSNILSKFNSDGSKVFNIGGRGSTGGMFRSAQGVCLDSKSNIYIADTGNRRIQIFNKEGIYVAGILSGDKLGAKTNNFILLENERFTGKPIQKQPKLKAPVEIGLDDEGYIFVLDTLARFIVIYNKNGEYMGNININNIRGIKDVHPIDMTIGLERIFVLDKKYHNIKIFQRDGRFIQEIGTKGTGRGQFYNPKAISMMDNKIYIIDAGNNRIQIFRYGKPKPRRVESTKQLTERIKLAIFNFMDTNKASKDKMLGSTVSEMLTTGFVNSNKFEVVERKEINRVVEELNFDISGMVSKDSAKEIGKLLGVELGLVGSVSVLSEKIQIDVRLLDMRTGIIMTATNKSISSEKRLRKEIFDLVFDIERAYMNRLGAPSPPEGLFAMPAIKNIFLKWDLNPEEDVIAYNIYMGKNKDEEFKKISKSENNECEIQDLKDNSVYYYYITAVDSEGKESDPSLMLETHTKKLPDFGYILKIKSQSLAKKIKFTWSNPEEEVIREYQVHRSNVRDGKYELIGTTQKKMYEDTGLYDGKEYFYRIKKVYPNGLVGGFSNSFSCFTDARPQTINDFEAIPDLARRIELQWKPSIIDKDLNKFYIFRADMSDGDFQEIIKLSSRQKKYIDRKLKDNTTYYYKIKSVDRFGLESDLSREIFATTKDIPSTPQEVVAESNLPRKIRLTWTFENVRNEDVTFIIYKSETMDGVFKELAKLKINEFIDRRLPDSKEYFYFISVKDNDGLVSNPSEIVSATTKPLPRIPNNIKVISNQARKITIHWDKNPEPDITHYIVYRSNKIKGPFKSITKTEETAFVDENAGKGLKDNTSYYYKVTAVDADTLESQFTEGTQGTTKALPSIPKDIVIEYKENSLVLSWPPVAGDDIFGYIIYKNRKKVEVIKTNLFVDKKVIVGKKYYYQISTLDNDQLESQKSEKVIYKIEKEKK
ncbi:hypothetical protein BVX93_01915 [bacterium B13(2017)]|nr:hypothetical protein BVX93_01915 [bacterium B13(2017)]